MKSQLSRVWVLGVAIIGLALGTGCEEDQARAEVPDIDKLVPELAPTASTTPAAAQTEPGATPLDPAAADLEKAGVSTNAPMPRLVAKPVMPENLKASPALEEVLKLAQAGVSEEVIMAYVVHSTNFFNVGSDAIVYLNDLGVPNNVITALIHHDSTPEMQARHQIANAVQPLPANIALTSPATNVYPQPVPPAVFAPAADTAAAPPPPQTEAVNVAAPEEPANVSYFYSSLAPYGTWVETDDYGLCWQPTVVVSNPGWRPYTDSGRWIWSNQGWYWYSDYSWGWAPFHYGRWCDYPRLGWVWVPDTQWGPSWVSWRYSSSYCGWAPLPPSCYYRPGFGFSYYGHSYGFSFGFDFGLSYHHYSYVPLNRFCDRSPGLHVLRGDRALSVHRGTTVVNNYVVGNNNTIINNGVGRDRIAAVTRGQVPTATVREGTTRGSTRREQIVNEGSSLAIVRPTLPPKPERSHVAVPNRSGITRISSENSLALNSAAGANGSGAANAVARPNSSGFAGRTAPSSAVNRQQAVPPVRSTEATPSPESRPSAIANNREASSPVTTAPRARSSEAVTRPNSSGFRSYARPSETRSENTPQVAVNNAPAPEPSVSRPQASTPSVTRPQPSAPVATAPAPSVSRSSAPVTSAPRATVPNSSGFRNNANPGASRPNAPSAPPPQVSRPSPSASAPVQSRPSYSAPASRPEPSRPSYSPPASRSEPSRSAPSSSPSYSAPSSRSSSPSYSAPSRPNSSGFGGGNSGGGSRGGGRSRD